MLIFETIIFFSKSAIPIQISYGTEIIVFRIDQNQPNRKHYEYNKIFRPNPSSQSLLISHLN